MTDNHHARTRLHVAEDERELLIDNDDTIDQQFQMASCSLHVSRSYVSLVTESSLLSPMSPLTKIRHKGDFFADLNTAIRNPKAH
jgi:hypothetical protein